MTQLDVAREALAQIGTRSKIASLDDGSAEAQYVNLLYAPIRDFLLVDSGSASRQTAGDGAMECAGHPQCRAHRLHNFQARDVWSGTDRVQLSF